MKFYITHPKMGTESIIAYGDDRLEALTNCGITVWTEEEFERAIRIMMEDKKK